MVRSIRLVLPVLAAGLCLWAVVRTHEDVPPTRRFEFVDGSVVEVERVLPGGGLDLGDGLVVRLLGVDVPTEPNASAQAAAWLEERVLGRDVALRFDRERLDEQGRILAYVVADTANLNVEIVAAGWARLDRDAAFSASVQRTMQKAETAARSDGLGIWSDAASR